LPEHREGTPERYATLESFLWRDFGEAGEWMDWVKTRQLGTPVEDPRSSFALALRLQHALRRLEVANSGAGTSPTAAATLNGLVGKFKTQPRVSPDGRLSLGPAPARARDPVALLLTMALNAMAEGVWHRFKLCRDPTCKASFYDASKSGTKVWCSMSLCGSRDKMRRLRRRRKA